MSNDMYVPKSTLRARFAVLTDDDVKSAVSYYQRQSGSNDKNAVNMGMDDVTSPDGQFVKGESMQSASSTTIGGDKPVEFAKIIEFWDHRDNLIKTFIEGVKKWAVQPYAPPQASTRFYPYFRLAFYEVDGSRHPQSLPQRLWKLQDEYSSTRSNFRLVRERSVPGTVFDSGNLEPEEAQKIANSAQMEMVGVRLTTPGAKVADAIAPKAIPRVDPALYDTSPIKYDMEVLTGVQEAQQSAIETAKTATEAKIQQSGFASRTGADRDTEEDMLTDLAQYTAELAIQSLDLAYVQKIAGPLAFWPAGMAVDDVLNLMDVEISAGTTGKPQADADKETWATLAPLIMQMMEKIQMLDVTNPPLAKAYRAFLRETLRRLDDRLDLDAIIPPPAATAAAITNGTAPGALPGAVPGAPPPAAGAPPVGNGTINNPGAISPPPPAA
jgi:hypothetical protein